MRTCLRVCQEQATNNGGNMQQDNDLFLVIDSLFSSIHVRGKRQTSKKKKKKKKSKRIKEN